MAKKKNGKNEELVAVERNVTRTLKPLDARWLKVERLKDNDHAEEADSAGAVVKALIKEIAAKRKEITRPLDASKKAVMAQAKTASAPLEKLEKHLKFLIREREAELRAIEMKAAEKKAKRLEKKGDYSLASDIREEAENAPVMHLAHSKVRDAWSAEVLDFMELLKAVVAGKVPLEAVMPNDVWLNAKARDLKSPHLDIDGVVGVNNRTTAISA